jgi:hydrogenase expression/formation protein HypE
VKPGKLTPAELATYVFPRCGVRRRDVLVHSALGQDASVVDFGDDVAILSTDPITGAGQRAGWLAVQIACNDVAVAGARPVGVLLTLLLAPTSATTDARALMDDAHDAAVELGIEILGGHSEMTAGLARSIVVATALGRCPRDRFVTSAGARPGDTILMTKAAGLEGTAVLANDFGSELANRVPRDRLESARAFLREISVVREALVAADAGVTAMHDATEGGILGALSELASAAGLGVEVDVEQIPIRPPTRAICDALEIDPLCLVSSGALLIASPKPAAVVAALQSGGCQVAEIGRIVQGSSVLRHHGQPRPLVPPVRDALWDAIERLTTLHDSQSGS